MQAFAELVIPDALLICRHRCKVWVAWLAEVLRFVDHPIPALPAENYFTIESAPFVAGVDSVVPRP